MKHDVLQLRIDSLEISGSEASYGHIQVDEFELTGYSFYAGRQHRAQLHASGVTFRPRVRV